MSMQAILFALYDMALSSAMACDCPENCTYTQEYAYAPDGALISVRVSARQNYTGEIVLACDDETYATTNFDSAAIALFNALQ